MMNFNKSTIDEQATGKQTIIPMNDERSYIPSEAKAKGDFLSLLFATKLGGELVSFQ